MTQPPPSRPAPLAAVHRIFIVTALAVAVFVSGWELRRFLRDGETSAAIGAGVGFGTACALAVYFRSLRNLGAKLSPRR